jgi:hypothetical protein
MDEIPSTGEAPSTEKDRVEPKRATPIVTGLFPLVRSYSSYDNDCRKEPSREVDQYAFTFFVFLMEVDPVLRMSS